jgi:predicted Zn finger-like uncharacterized protein
MILTCPSCATSYFTPDEAIGPTGRTVRCKSCQHTWRASLDEPLELGGEAPVEPASFGSRDEAVSESLAETPAPELPKAFRARAEQQRRLRRAAAHGAVWAGIASGFALLLASAWLFRVEVVETFPKAAAAYAAVGSPVNPTGLDFEAISASPSPGDPGRVLVSGALRNVRDNEVVAPPVRVALLDVHGAEIGHAVVRIDAAPVLPGKVQGFAALIDDPGGKGQGVGVDFTTVEAAIPLRPARIAPKPRPLPEADEPVQRAAEIAPLRPALAPGPTTPADLHPIDARPIQEAEALDSRAAEAVSASHG